MQENIRQSIANTKVPLNGNIRVEVKNEKAIRITGVNIDIMSFWLEGNYKAERPEFIFEKHRVDIAGLQEVCINWSDLRSSQTLASILSIKAKTNRSVASHNERETKTSAITEGEEQQQSCRNNLQHS